MKMYITFIAGVSDLKQYIRVNSTHSVAISTEMVHCYLDGVRMCLIHQEVLLAPRYEFLSVSSYATPILNSVPSSTSISQ